MTTLLTIQEAARDLGISTKTLRKFVDKGQLATIHVGLGGTRRHVRISREDLQALRAALKVNAYPEPEPAPAAETSKPKQKKRAQKVYFIRAADIVKIGVAVDPQERLRTLQVARTERLELLLTLNGGVEREARLHNLFAAQCVGGEWFTYAGPVAAYIEKIKSSE